MRVALASYQAVSILRGGPNTQLRQTAAHLPEHGVEPLFFNPWEPFDRGGVDLFHLFGANIGTYHLGREIRALDIPLAVSPIIYSSHSIGVVRAGLAVSRILQSVWRGSWTDYALTSDLCKWAAALLPNTSAEARLVTDGLGADRGKVTVIPNGVEERFGEGNPSLFRKEYGIDDFILNVGHVGHERKNVLALIRALGKIDHPAVIIGRIIRSPYGEACVAEAKKYPQIRLLDGIDHSSDMLASAYAACRVFALPSLFETPGIAALEAGLAGARIVITEEGGTREYFGDMAHYVDPRSDESIRQGIVRALNEPPNPRLKNHIGREFTWGEVARKTSAAYRALGEMAGPG